MKQNFIKFWDRNKNEIKAGIVFGGSILAIVFLMLFGFRKKVVKKHRLEEIVYIDE